MLDLKWSAMSVNAHSHAPISSRLPASGERDCSTKGGCSEQDDRFGPRQRLESARQELRRAVGQSEECTDGDEHPFKLRPAVFKASGNQVISGRLNAPALATHSLRLSAEHSSASLRDLFVLQVDEMTLGVDRFGDCLECVHIRAIGANGSVN